MAERSTRRLRTSRLARNLRLARLGARVGGVYAGTAARKTFASAERRAELDRTRELATAQQVADELGHMKGALMKLGQMASYLDEGLPEPLRQALSQLQSNAPPMATHLVVATVEAELGRPIGDVFVEFDPEPIAAASIGQVHRAIVIDPVTGAERAVAVKVQYPGIGEAIESDLKNADLLGTILRQGFGGLDPDEMVEEIKLRLTEELDYRIEARNQAGFADDFRGHPFIRIPEVLPAFSTARVLTSELVVGFGWQELLRTTAGRARPGRRDHLPVRVPQPVHARGLQRRSASGQLRVPRRRHGHVPRLRTGQALHADRDGNVRLDGRRRPSSTATPRSSGPCSNRRGCSDRTRRCRPRTWATTSRTSTTPCATTRR